ncbi:MAG: hypothetical protein J6V94_00305 [Lachnospiraceae bacterium]|nr:hypothetical protein [Lachnospiraceae bacterium]MBP5252923.1 hypothetical protein [Lachnospiraceae bacterium]
MNGINGINAYQQNAQAVNSSKTYSSENTKAAASAKEASSSKTETKAWSPIDVTSSLVPRKTDYGFTIGDVKLSDTAADYYKTLKSKFGTMEFIVVSKDMKAQVQQNAAAYGNARKQVVLIDEEKLEKMATDEDYRNKYEGIIAMSQMKLLEAKNSLASTGANVKNFGMSVDANGNEKLFATIEKSTELQKERIEKKAEEKKELKAEEKKEAAKKEREERIEKGREERKAEDEAISERIDTDEHKDYVMIEAFSMHQLLNKVSDYSYDYASNNVMTEAERSLGTQIDFRG